MASAPFRAINSRLASRSIRVVISPAPSTFAERRSILQVLQKYGPIDIFRRENVMEANRYISVTRSEDTAKALTHLSPIACHISLPRIEPEQRARQLQSLTESTTQPRIEFQTRVAKSGREEEEEEQQQQQTEQQRQQEQDSDEHGVDFETREFVLTIGPARDYDHGRAASKATEHTSWPDGYEADKSFAVMALRETLPDTLLKKGLCYWHVKPAAPDAPRDTMRQRLERKQQIPGQMAAAADMPKFSPIPRRRK